MVLLVPSLATGYGTRVHHLLARCAIGSKDDPCGGDAAHELLPGIADADLAAFRAWLYSRAAAMRDTAVRHAFLGRYPRAESFNAAAMKEFLMMDAAAHVLGVDSFAAVYRRLRPVDRNADRNPDYVAGRPIALGTAVELGSIYPDLDRRNQSRLLRGATLTPWRTVRGDSVPFDPMSLNMGRLTGLSSQAHAHYGLNRHAKSTEPSVLKSAPWDFALAIGFEGAVETYARDNAQLYSDLALLAALDGRPSGRALGAIYAGNAMHYVGDVGNAIHTVQVGIYPIFVDATVQYWLRRASHLFGLLGRTPSRNEIGLDIISNLHTLSERLFEVELVEAVRAGTGGPAVRRSILDARRGMETGNDSLARALDDTLGLLRRSEDAPAFGRAITDVLVDAGNRDGAEVYRLTRQIAKDDLRTGRISVDFDTVPDDQVWHWLRADDVEHNRLDAFNAVETRGVARSTAALRTWWAEYQRQVAFPAARRGMLIDRIVTRLVSERLRYLEAAEARRRTWIAAHGGLAP